MSLQSEYSIALTAGQVRLLFESWDLQLDDEMDLVRSLYSRRKAFYGPYGCPTSRRATPSSYAQLRMQRTEKQLSNPWQMFT